MRTGVARLPYQVGCSCQTTKVGYTDVSLGLRSVMWSAVCNLVCSTADQWSDLAVPSCRRELLSSLRSGAWVLEIKCRIAVNDEIVYIYFAKSLKQK